MKHLKHLFFVLPLLLTGCSDKENKELDPNIEYDNVYLIMGQSNASGVSQHSFLETSHPDFYQKYTVGNDKVLISYDCDDRIETKFVPTKFGFGHDETFFGPEIGISDVLAKNHDHAYIIKATLSGSALRAHYVDQHGFRQGYYDRFVSFIESQLKALENQGKHPRLRGLFWMQGESDAMYDDPETYRYEEQTFYEYLLHDLSNWIYEYFNFVDAYISTRTFWTHSDVVNSCKQDFSESNKNCYCFKTNGEDESSISLFLKSETSEGDDAAHYCSSSMLLLGVIAGQYLIK